MTTGGGIRQRARAELTEQIKRTAREQLATTGAQGLSLRAVSRELGMASSALYRYFPSRDELLTALIVDAYRAVGDAARAADKPRAGARTRWLAVCRAIRRWARENPHEYALLYGSPVTGYRAPETTVEPASAAILVLAEIVAEAAPTAPTAPAVNAKLSRQASRTIADTALEGRLEPAIVLRLLSCWSRLFGLLSFELFGHFVGSADPADDFFEYEIRDMADHVGLPGR